MPRREDPVLRPGKGIKGKPGRLPPGPRLRVTCETLTRDEVVALLDEFDAKNVVFRALKVHGSPFVELSISPTRANSD
jgi:hypothetical protein